MTMKIGTPGYRAEPLPALATAATAEGHPRQAQTGAGAQAPTAAEGVRATAVHSSTAG
jgi:hypothetical protein